MDYTILKVLQNNGGQLPESTLFTLAKIPRKQYEQERTELLMAHNIEVYLADKENGLRIVKEKPKNHTKRTETGSANPALSDDKDITTIDKRTYGYFNSVESWADRLADFYGDVDITEGESGEIWTVEGVEDGRTYKYRVEIDDAGGLMVSKARRAKR